MKGARALSGVIVLAAVCTLPAVSAAQESDSPADAGAATSTTTLDQAIPPGQVAPPTGPAAGGDLQPAQAQATPEQAAPPPDVTVSSSSSSDGAHASASASVTMADFSFSPASVTVAVGDTVTWHNTGQAPHTATANDGSFDTGTVNPGGSASHRFTSPGTFSYVCTIHPNMHGTVRVLSASGGGGKGGGSGGTAGSSSSSGSNLTEEQAVASPNAAGNSTTLPMTGLAAGALALVGAALLALGVAVRLASDRPVRRRVRFF